MTTLSLLTSAAQMRAGRVLIADGPDIGRLTGRPRLDLTAASLRERAGLMAAQFDSFGLGRDHVVLLVLPNAVDLGVAMLACHIVGAIPAPFGMHEPVDRIRAAAEASGATAIVTLGRFAALQPAEMARQAAARVLGVRFVMAFGERLPDGVIALDGWSEEDQPPAVAPVWRDSTAPALISFESRGRTLVALARSHAQLIAEAMAIATLARIDGASTILSTIPAASAVGVAASLVLPLMTGAAVELHPLFDSEVFLAQIGRLRGAVVIAPGLLETALHALDKADPGCIGGVIAIQRAEDGLAQRARPFGRDRAIDLVSLGESATFARSRSEPLPLDVVPARIEHPIASVLPQGEAWLETALDGYARLLVAGFGCPRQVGESRPAASLATGFMGSPVAGGARLQPPPDSGSRDAA